MSQKIMKLENELTVSLTKLNIEAVLSSSVTPQKFIQLASMAVMSNQFIADQIAANKVDLGYMSNQLMMCAKDGLLLDNKEATLTPFFSKKRGLYELVYIPMVLGLKKRVIASGDIVKIDSFIVCEGELFEHYRNQDGEFFTHKPNYDENADVKLAVAVAKDKYGNTYIEIANRQKIEMSRLSSKGSGSENSPWFKYFDRMAELVPLRRLCRKLPNASELIDLTSRDANHEDDISHKEEKVINPIPLKKSEEKPKPVYSAMGFDEVSQALDLINSKQHRNSLLMLNDRCKELLNSGEVNKEQALVLKSKIAIAKDKLS